MRPAFKDASGPTFTLTNVTDNTTWKNGTLFAIGTDLGWAETAATLFNPDTLETVIDFLNSVETFTTDYPAEFVIRKPLVNFGGNNPRCRFHNVTPRPSAAADRSRQASLQEGPDRRSWPRMPFLPHSTPWAGHAALPGLESRRTRTAASPARWRVQAW